MMRPSWTATTLALGALIRSTSCSGGSLCGRALPRPLVATDAGEGAAAPGAWAALAASATGLAGALAALDGSPAAVALPVALERAGSNSPQPTCLPVTGSRPSIRPVRVATTERG